MGDCYWLVCHKSKTFVNPEGCKLTEMNNDFDRRLIQEFIEYHCHNTAASIEWVPESNWDSLKGYEDETCDMLLYLFERDFVPSYWQLSYILRNFQNAHRLKELSPWLEKWDKKGTSV